MFGGQVGIAGHIRIADGTKIGAQAGVISTIKEENRTLQGSPAIDMKNFFRSTVIFNKLPELKTTIDRLEKETGSQKK